jgi:YD repeat-containing protein
MVISDFLWTAPDGTQRMFPISTIQENPGDSGCPDRPTANGFANDASGFKMFITDYIQATIYAPDGTQVFPSAEDTNGNVFSKDGNGNVIDTLGRTPVTYVPNGANCSTSYCYNVVNSHGTTSQIKVTTTTVSVNTAFGVAGVTEYSGNLTVIQKITLPDQTFYQFGYDSYGEINSVTLPTGGVITYGYTNYQDSFGSRNRWVTSRSSGGGNWSYTPAVITTCGSGQVGCQQKVTVVAPSTNQTVYTFTLNNGAWKSQLQSYTGSTTLLSTTSQAWDFSQACTPTPCTGASNIRVLTTTTTLPTPGGNNVTNQTKVTYNDTNTMNIASIMTWKFYAGTSPTFPTIPDHETDFTYHALIGNNILNLVSQTTGKDSAGNVAAQTNFLYDSEVSGSLANSNPSTGISQHDDANYGLTNTARGNLTAINRCTNLSSCTSNYVQTVMTYDTTGQVLSVKDPNGNTRNLELRLRR